MRHRGSIVRAAAGLAMWPLIIIFSPAILVAGEPVNRFVRERMRRRAAVATWATATGPGDQLASAPLPLHLFLLFYAMRNPLWIALTAPGRWVGDQFRRPPSGPRRIVRS